jgi:UTP-glucose-1-phosphate uridylyltransferase
LSNCQNNRSTIAQLLFYYCSTIVFLEVEDLVEKPTLKDAPSNLAILGRYIIHPEIFDILAKQRPDPGEKFS